MADTSDTQVRVVVEWWESADGCRMMSDEGLRSLWWEMALLVGLAFKGTQLRRSLVGETGKTCLLTTFSTGVFPAEYVTSSPPVTRSSALLPQLGQIRPHSLREPDSRT